MLEDRVGGVDGHLVVGGVAVREPEVVVLDREVEVGEDELLLDLGPVFFSVFFFRFRGEIFRGGGKAKTHYLSRFLSS